MVSSHRRCLRTIACGRRETCHGEALRQLSEGGGNVIVAVPSSSSPRSCARSPEIASGINDDRE